MPQRRIVLSLAVLYALALALIALWPTPVDRPLDGMILDVVRRAHELGMPGWFGYDLIEFLANVALFAPFGFFVSALLDTHPAVAVLVGLATSASIEILQHIVRPERFATLSDVAANTSGAVIGVGIAHLMSRSTAGQDSTPGQERHSGRT